LFSTTDSTQRSSFLKPSAITVAVNTKFSGKIFASSVIVSEGSFFLSYATEKYDQTIAMPVSNYL